MRIQPSRLCTGRDVRERHERRARAVTGRAPMTAAGVGLRVLAATAAFALLHSALASRAAKETAAKLAGERRANGLYRAFFNTQATVTSAALVLYLRRLPDRDLYSLRGRVAGLMRAGQAAGLLLLMDAVRQAGVLRLTGASSLVRLARADADVAAPEAQGPSHDEHGALRVRGAFLRSRHPLNLAPVPILWLNPRMTRNAALFSAMATAYFWVGSWHEERRLLAAYGAAYRAYMQSGVPFFFSPRTLLGAPPQPRGPHPPSVRRVPRAVAAPTDPLHSTA